VSAFTQALSETWPTIYRGAVRAFSRFGRALKSSALRVVSTVDGIGIDPAWDERIMLIGTEEFLAARFNLEKLPPAALS